MGQEIPTSQFTQHDFDVFAQRLRDETRCLHDYFQEDRFCSLHNVGGFEIEAWLVDSRAMPNPINDRFLELLDNPLVVMELARFNVELNVEPQVLKGCALKMFQQDLEKTWNHCCEVAGQLDADLMTIGIHPGVTDNELNLANMSTSPRYTALNEQVLARRRGLPLVLDIHGRETLNARHFDVMLEAATTSFQIHLQVRPEKAVRAINAASIVSAPLLAVSANSPYLFGHDLWDESRIPLFEQAVDDGSEKCKRVSFGRDYIRDSLFTCFEQNLADFPPLLPIDMKTPRETFAHLRLHNGTVWRWNRPLIGFGDNDSVHLRIENRVVPSGPTLPDMIANAVFFWGLTRSLTDQETAPESCIDFSTARDNFYRAARDSLQCNVRWLDGKDYPVRDLIVQQLVPLAREGLVNLDVDSADCDHYLDIIRQRAENNCNGALWQRRYVDKHGCDMQALSQAYLELQHTRQPVHGWPL